MNYNNSINTSISSSSLLEIQPLHSGSDNSHNLKTFAFLLSFSALSSYLLNSFPSKWNYTQKLCQLSDEVVYLRNLSAQTKASYAPRHSPNKNLPPAFTVIHCLSQMTSFSHSQNLLHLPFLITKKLQYFSHSFSLLFYPAVTHALQSSASSYCHKSANILHNLHIS